MVKGILLGFLAMAIFSCGDAAVKAIGDRMTVFEIAFFATLFACVALPFVRQPHERWRDMFRMHRPGLVMVRTVAGVLAGVFSILAFTTLPFAEVYSLIFLSPLFVTILSIPFLGETDRVEEGARDPDRLCRRAARRAAGFSRADAGTSRGGGRVALRRGHGAGAPRSRADREAHHADGRGLRRGDRRQRHDHGCSTSSCRRRATCLLAAFAGLCGGVAHMLLMAAVRDGAREPRRAGSIQPDRLGDHPRRLLFFDEFPDATAIAGIALVTFAGLFTFAREEKRGVRFPPVWTMVWGRSGQGGGADNPQEERSGTQSPGVRASLSAASATASRGRRAAAWR